MLYTAAAVYVVQDELRHSGGGWINLRGLGVTLATAPSQVTFGVLLEWLGVARVNYAEPGPVPHRPRQRSGRRPRRAPEP